MVEFTAATLNLNNRANRWLARRGPLVAQLVDGQPDLLALQEVYFPLAQARWLRNQVNSRISGSSREPYRLVQRRKRHLINGYFEGVAILSKLPIITYDSLSLGYGGRVALRVNVELPSRQSFDFVTVHLHHTQHDRQARLEQTMTLIGWLNDRNRAPLQLIAGDFNETPDGPAIQQMKLVYDSAYERVYGREPIATFPTAVVADWGVEARCLDYIFLSKAFHAVQSAGLFCHRPTPDDPTLYPSDHVGLIARFAVTE
jgi:endonuclease/exonuclease/phosphatase family metal-dependent hydrolase